MRIARVLTRLNFGGPARQVLASDPELVARGHQVRVFAGAVEPGEGDLFDELVARGVDVVRVPGLGRKLSFTRDFSAGRFLRRQLAAFEPQVVHTHASKAGVLGRRAAFALDPRPAIVHTFHGHVLEGYFPPTLTQILIAIERRWATRSDRIVAVSHATADDLVRLEVVDETQLVVVPPGIEMEPFLALDGRSGALRTLLEIDADAFVVGVIGRLASVKQPQRAIAVFQTLAARYPKLHLAFVGDGEERRMLERAIGQLPQAERERVHLAGALPDMPAVLADLDAVLGTSRSEGLPVALIEAAAAAVPVVARDVGGVAEVVAHERTGFVGPEDDDLAFGLAQLLDDRALGPAMGQRARLRVAQRYSAGALADRLLALYEAASEEAACAS